MFKLKQTNALQVQADYSHSLIVVKMIVIELTAEWKEHRLMHKQTQTSLRIYNNHKLHINIYLLC